MYHLSRKTFIKSSRDGNYVYGHSVVAQQDPQHVFADAIKSLVKIYRVDVQGVSLLLSECFLQCNAPSPPGPGMKKKPRLNVKIKGFHKGSFKKR